jgi:hypothetical protein
MLYRIGAGRISVLKQRQLTVISVKRQPPLRCLRLRRDARRGDRRAGGSTGRRSGLCPQQKQPRAVVGVRATRAPRTEPLGA